MRPLAEVLTFPVWDEDNGEKARREGLRGFVFHPVKHRRVANWHRPWQGLPALPPVMVALPGLLLPSSVISRAFMTLLQAF